LLEDDVLGIDGKEVVREEESKEDWHIFRVKDGTSCQQLWVCGEAKEQNNYLKITFTSF
jgi:hypothetical protein